LKNSEELRMQWEVENSDRVFKDRWLNVRADRCRMPGGKIVEPYYVLEYPDWINVFGITRENEVVLVRQYRHGIGKTVVELPSGTVERQDRSPLEAARRELLEETGYTSDRFIKTGIVSPNPSNQNNLAHCFLARNLEWVQPPQLDDTEEIETVLVPLANALKMLQQGEFLQAIHVSSIYYAMNCLETDQERTLSGNR
jgi:ADP-ribose diphosphatase